MFGCHLGYLSHLGDAHVVRVGEIAEVVARGEGSPVACHHDELHLWVFVGHCDEIFVDVVHGVSEGVEAARTIEDDPEPVAPAFPQHCPLAARFSVLGCLPAQLD